MPDQKVRLLETPGEMASQTNGLVMTWENISVYLSEFQISFLKLKNKLSSGDSSQKNLSIRDQLIDNVSGIARPNEVLAILGPSGAGKSTLLNVLNSRNRGSLRIVGDILINGTYIDEIDNINSICGYVQQNDLFIGTLKVKEHLFFQAMLRMDRNATQTERMDRINSVLDNFNLSKCQDCLIGNPEMDIKGISGGEMRRLSFASEIITNPSILFCDEPTSGLDSFMAMSIVESMKNLAKTGKTIICTIHQPSSEIFEMFDKICLLSEGRLGFIGTHTQAAEFFEQQGLKCPEKYNPADYYIKKFSITPHEKDQSKKQVMKICDGFDKSDTYQGLTREINAINCQDLPLPKSTELEKSSIFTQIRWLFWRSRLDLYRDPLNFKLNILQTILVGLLYGLIFFKLELNQEGIQNVNGILFTCILNVSFGAIFAVINTFPKEVPIFVRESQCGMYRVFSYFVSKVLIELPMQFIVPFLQISILYWMTNLNNEFHRYVIFCTVLIEVSYTCSGYSQLMSLLFSSKAGPTEIATPLVIPLLVFSGFFLHNNSVPKVFLILKYLSWFGYANEALIINQWHGNVTIGCDKIKQLCFTNGDDVLDYFNAQPENLAFNMGMLLYLIVGFKILAFVTLYIKSYKK